MSYANQDTVLLSRMTTRINTAETRLPKIRYAKGTMLGYGRYADVFEATDVDSGNLMAVKILRRPPGTSEQEWKMLLRGTRWREVKIHSQISHPHIVNFIASQGWDTGEVETFIGLKEGSLQSLVSGGCSIDNLGPTVLYHMLQAIDFLAMQGIIHRDIKPENILYESRAGQYHFQLGDFGFSDYEVAAKSPCGTWLYMAPEVFNRGKQTHRIDVWALYVTILWTLDVGGFRKFRKRIRNHNEAVNTVLTLAANERQISDIQEMAKLNPEARATAAQMLIKLYGGHGLTWFAPLRCATSQQSSDHGYPRVETLSGAGHRMFPKADNSSHGRQPRRHQAAQSQAQTKPPWLP
ncbi:kinase-like domain-containing protein [Whalleya microplaca]|nr:kinase-like domain-containing protein [Whalleya microplaca]